ncbi:MAG TPA: hypothetical protein VKX96_07820, partial [Chloroflexota bacterium]|nr:hypothetical protein [Chloroflexota bacterium]
MLIRADVKCYYCGHVSGQVEGDPDDPKTVWSYHPGSEPASRSIPRQNSIRCNRCGGPVYLDEIETVRTHSQAVHQAMAR